VAVVPRARLVVKLACAAFTVYFLVTDQWLPFTVLGQRGRWPFS
jgi:hypothetical protein